jgi:hypothetical protein
VYETSFMSVLYTSTRFLSALGLNDMCRLTQLDRLTRFLFVSPALCLRLPSDSVSR